MQPISIALFTIGALRLAGNPALAAARQRGAVLPLFVWAPDDDGAWAPGAASRWWLDGSLRGLDAELRRRGSRLVVRRASTTADAVARLIDEVGATSVTWQRGVTPAECARDASLQARLEVECVVTPPNLLVDPAAMAALLGHPARVFGRYWRAAEPLISADPWPCRVPDLQAPSRWPPSEAIDALLLQPRIDWAGGLRETWTPGEQSAHIQLKRFIGDLENYAPDRNIPSVDATTRLSPHLHFGEISVHQVWSAIAAAQSRGGDVADAPRVHTSATALRRELGWRDYAHYVLQTRSDASERSLSPQFDRIAWRSSPTDLRAWQRGRTGYPLIDAGMRQLWHTGWMHNRVRMAVASFLVKDLLLSWQAGARWFWDTLVDADLANNSLGWQWSAGSGADAAPFPRIFNPTLQAERFDPDGAYIRRWVPELARVPLPYLLHPWDAPPLLLAAAQVELGRTYPRPLIDHAFARRRALAALPAT